MQILQILSLLGVLLAVVVALDRLATKFEWPPWACGLAYCLFFVSLMVWAIRVGTLVKRALGMM